MSSPDLRGYLKQVTQYLDDLMNREKSLLIIGDLNFCFLSASSILVTNYLNANSFSQIVEEPTHIEGNLIDQAYLRDRGGNYKCSLEVQSKYYTDHKGLALILRRYE